MSISDRLDEIEARADEAADLIGALAAGTSSWRMRVPVNEEDSDVTLMSAVEGCEKAVAALRAVLDLCDKALAVKVSGSTEGDAAMAAFASAALSAITAALGEES